MENDLKQIIVNLTEEEDHIVDNIKKEFNLNNKSNAIRYIIKEYNHSKNNKKEAKK